MLHICKQNCNSCNYNICLINVIAFYISMKNINYIHIKILKML